jgi:hypothetical protein
MFFRPGGSDSRISVQFDEVYADQIGGATGWLPINKGDWIAVNVCRALLTFVNSASSVVTKQPGSAPEMQLILEMKTIGGQSDAEAWPIDNYQNTIVAKGMNANRDGWVRLRILNINNMDGTGLAMALQVSRNGVSP